MRSRSPPTGAVRTGADDDDDGCKSRVSRKCLNRLLAGVEDTIGDLIALYQNQYHSDNDRRIASLSSRVDTV